MARAGKTLRVSEDLVPVSDFKARAADLLKRVTKTGQPLVITQNGKAAGVLVSPARFDELTERERFADSVREGVADLDAGRSHTHAQVVEGLKNRRASRKKR